MATKLSTEELLAQFETLTLLELSEFVKAFEEKFDVTAAAPATPSPMPTPVSVRLWPSTRPSTCARRAPRARRIPISVTRRFTAYDVTPYKPRAAMTSASAPKNPESIATSRSCRTDANT